MATLLLRNIGWLYTCDAGERVLRNAWLLAKDGRVVDIGKEPCPHAGADAVEDLAGCIVLPGLISLHHHFFQSLTRAIPQSQRARSLDWLFGMYPVWSGISPQDMRWGSLAAASEMLLTGGTTCADHSYYLPGKAGEMVEAQVDAAAQAGLRLHLVRGCMPTIEGDLAERLGPLLGGRLAGMLDDPKALFGRIEADIARYHDASPGSMLRVDLGPTGVTYAQPALMRQLADVAHAHGLGLHTHFHPRQFERDACLRNTGRDTISFLRDSGWLTPRAWYAHCPELSDAEMAAFADAGCGVAHCPRTVVRLGYSLTRISAMRQRGVRVGIGIDGAASNDDGSMLGDLRLALLLHRTGAAPEIDPEEEWLTPYDALLMATRVGAQVLGRDDIGRLEAGKCADIAAFDLRKAAYSGALTDPLGGLLMCGSDATAALTVVNGKIVVRGGKLLTASEGEIATETNRVASRLLDEAQGLTGIDFRAYPKARVAPQFS
jgi:8-oxoguanine deaminase